MKLELIGNDERYTVEQALLALFPEERPVYGAADRGRDARWASVALEPAEEGGRPCCRVRTEVCWDGETGLWSETVPLAGTDYQREGQRRRAVTRCFFLAARKAAGIAPPWGSLTGVRPGKLAAGLLEQGRTPAEAEAELREFYFVAPRRARLAVEAAREGLRARDGLGPRDIAVYIGIPFCPTRCAYCSFVSASVERSFALVEPYLDALCAEVRAGGELAARLGLRVRAFYIGGGTPTTLTAAQLDRLLGVFASSFDLRGCREVTVEAGRPDTVTPEKLAVLRRRGVTRLSVNPQTMDDRVLAAIGRRHTAQDIRRAMGQAAEAGFAHINMDLIAGLPEDSPEGFRRSLDECAAFGADNLTVHTLSLKKGSAILTENLAIPSAEAVGQMLDYADPALRTAGYAPYYLYRQKYMSGSFENVGWCRPGAENLYNIYIMEELCSILSFGAGGSTKMVDAAGSRICRAFNLKYPKEYTERPEKWQSNQAAFAAFMQTLEGRP
jgi:oxygen-independent coproporphyrinogen-3 oxidase